MTLLNTLLVVTLWLSIPVGIALFGRRRAPEWQRSCLRACALGLPIVVAACLALGRDASRSPWLALEESATNSEQSAASSIEPARVERELFEPASIESVLASEFQPGVVSEEVWSLESSEYGSDTAAINASTIEPTVSGSASLPPLQNEPTHPSSVLGSFDSQSIPIEWTTIAVAAWALFALFGVLRLAVGGCALVRWRRSWKAASPAASARLRELAARAGIGERVELRTTPTLTEAAATGVRRPCVVIPVGWDDAVASGALDAILLHELAHLRARDPLWLIVWSSLRALYWPHPLVHWAARRDATLAEYAADREAVWHGAKRREYAHLLNDLVAARLAAGAPSSLDAMSASHLFGPLSWTRETLEGRIMMILKAPTRQARAWLLPTLVMAVALSSILLARPLVGWACDPEDAPPTIESLPILQDLFTFNDQTHEPIIVLTGDETDPEVVVEGGVNLVIDPENGEQFVIVSGEDEPQPIIARGNFGILPGTAYDDRTREYAERLARLSKAESLDQVRGDIQRWLAELRSQNSQPFGRVYRRGQGGGEGLFPRWSQTGGNARGTESRSRYEGTEEQVARALEESRRSIEEAQRQMERQFEMIRRQFEAQARRAEAAAPRVYERAVRGEARATSPRAPRAPRAKRAPGEPRAPRVSSRRAAEAEPTPAPRRLLGETRAPGVAGVPAPSRGALEREAAELEAARDNAIRHYRLRSTREIDELRQELQRVRAKEDALRATLEAERDGTRKLRAEVRALKERLESLAESIESRRQPR